MLSNKMQQAVKGEEQWEAILALSLVIGIKRL